MSAFHTTTQDLRKEESRFGSKNEDVSAMKVRIFALENVMLLGHLYADVSISPLSTITPTRARKSTTTRPTCPCPTSPQKPVTGNPPMREPSTLVRGDAKALSRVNRTPLCMSPRPQPAAYDAPARNGIRRRSPWQMLDVRVRTILVAFRRMPRPGKRLIFSWDLYFYNSLVMSDV